MKVAECCNKCVVAIESSALQFESDNLMPSSRIVPRSNKSSALKMSSPMPSRNPSE